MHISRQDLIVAAQLFFLVFLVHFHSPNLQTYDSRWSVHTTVSLIREGDANLDEYLPQLEETGFYHIECVFPDGRRIRRLQDRSQCAGGHFYHFYPLGVPILTSIAVAPLDYVTRTFQPGLGEFADRYLRTPYYRMVLHGDLVPASQQVEILVASLLIALSTAVLFLLAREWLSAWPAAFTALVFAFGTSAWSTSSRALWMHGFSVVLLVIAFWMLRWGVNGRRWAWPAAGLLLLFAFFVRPTNVVPLVGVAGWILWKHRRQAFAFATGMLPVLVLFATVHLQVYKSVIPPYSKVTRSQEAGLSIGPHIPVALAGNLISPSRGIFVYTPIVLFSLAGLWLWYRRPETRDWAMLLGAIFLGHYLLISAYEDWFGGHGYGPRYFADLAPLLVMPLAGLLATKWRWTWGAPFLLCVAVSLFMHHQGAWCWPCMRWDSEPAEIRESEWRLWSWRDPMFLRGFQPEMANAPLTEPATSRKPE